MVNEKDIIGKRILYFWTSGVESFYFQGVVLDKYRGENYDSHVVDFYMVQRDGGVIDHIFPHSLQKILN